MKKTWILVANRSDAKIYKAETSCGLVEHKSLTHAAAHLHDSEIISDASGCMSRRGLGSETLSPKKTVQEKEAISFAKEIAAFLEQGCHAQECEKLYIIAKAPFLGFLRHELHPNVVKIVEAEIQKDIVNFNLEEIRSYLPKIL